MRLRRLRVIEQGINRSVARQCLAYKSNAVLCADHEVAELLFVRNDHLICRLTHLRHPKIVGTVLACCSALLRQNPDRCRRSNPILVVHQFNRGLIQSVGKLHSVLGSLRRSGHGCQRVRSCHICVPHGLLTLHLLA